MTCATNAQQNNVANKFISFTNSWQTDSLSKLLSDDFKLIRTYNQIERDKNWYTGYYMSVSRACHGAFDIIQTNSDRPTVFIVEDNSDFIQYLGVAKPKWQITVATRGEEVYLVTIDSLKGAYRYFKELTTAVEEFESWLKETHPAEIKKDLFANEILLPKRLKEYAAIKK